MLTVLAGKLNPAGAVLRHLKLAIKRAVKLARNNTGMTLSLAFDYGGFTIARVARPP